MIRPESDPHPSSYVETSPGLNSQPEEVEADELHVESRNNKLIELSGTHLICIAEILETFEERDLEPSEDATSVSNTGSGSKFFSLIGQCYPDVLCVQCHRQWFSLSLNLSS